MTDTVKLVVEVDEHLYERIKNFDWIGDTSIAKSLCAIANSTPLPKGHGRLIDADALKETFIEPNIFLKCNEKGFWCFTSKEIKNAPTIVEADKEESEE